MAKHSGPSLRSGTRRFQLIRYGAGLAAALAAGLAGAAEGVREQAFRAMLEGDWEQAAKHWAQVGGDRAAAYQQQAQAEWRQRQARQLMEQAAKARQTEDWAAADALYLKALTVSPYMKAAQQERAKVAPYVAAHRELGELKIEEGLYDAVARARARQWLARLDRQGLRDRRLEQARRELATAFKRAETPVPLTLTSDGLSQLEIYGVGQLGQLERETLQLLPGDYVAVASRPGFRDVQMTLRVRPGESLTADLRCTESIR